MHLGIRTVGVAPATKSLTNTKPAGALAETGGSFTPLKGMEHAQRWCAALGSDTAALAGLYSDDFTLERTFVDDLLESTYWEDNGVFVALGLPILRPHYWREDFDMEAFVTSLGG